MLLKSLLGRRDETKLRFGVVGIVAVALYFNLGKEAMKIRSLKEILSYEHPDVVDAFLARFPMPDSEAKEIFQEMLKMMWLMAIRKEEAAANVITSPDRINVFEQMRVLDEMWHTFILFSQDYHKFCETNFGYYLHHMPTTVSDRKRERLSAQADPIAYGERYARDIEVQCRYICEKLGVETLVTWFQKYPTQYPIFQSSPEKRELSH